jgi:hypothetical protein
MNAARFVPIPTLAGFMPIAFLERLFAKMLETQRNSSIPSYSECIALQQDWGDH